MTPLLDALRGRAERGTIRFHMPGHAGKTIPDGRTGLTALSELFEIDFTELSDTGSLYADGHDGPIREAEMLYAKCYAAGDCLFLTCGATQGILAMLAAFASPGDKVALDRNCHISVHNALALLDLRPVWFRAPTIEPFRVSAGINPQAIGAALKADPDVACALVTSPTYYGVLSDIKALSKECDYLGIHLLVDAAHGAHLPFLPPFAAPVAQGAAASVMSAHKTLPALGQAAFLLTAQGVEASRLRECTAVFGTSSPSYVLMASLDAARDYMENGGREKLAAIAGAARQISGTFPSILGHPGNGSFTNLTDPMRLCLYTGHGKDVAAWLEGRTGIVCEMADANNTLFLLSPLSTHDELDHLTAALELVTGRLPSPPSTRVCAPDGFQPVPPRLATPRQALFAAQETLPLSECQGRITARPIANLPPCSPLVAGGELLDNDTMEFLKWAGFQGKITVMKEEGGEFA